VKEVLEVDQASVAARKIIHVTKPSSKGRTRVLVVEDNADILANIYGYLEPLGYELDSARDGFAALSLASDREYDVIVLDIMLPGLSGYRVAQEMRRAKVWTPVLMLTAKDGEYDEADAFDIGADDYLTKPFSYVVLVARLRSLVRRGAPERPAVLEAGDLRLDPAGHRVARGDVELTLTPREFALLQYLMRHRDQVLSKTQILENVWDAHYDGDDNIVEVYVGYLRKKIDAPFGRRSIDTVRGVGYRWLGNGG
jgi:two-component system OmpR family response regulator